MMTRNMHREQQLHISMKYMAEFKAGVTSMLRSWNALKTAVAQQWGGIESAAKAEDLRKNIFEAYDLSINKKPMDIYELQENIFSYMEEEFSIVLEDESDKQVAEMICRLFEQCCQNEDLTFYREIMEMENRINSMPKDEIMLKVEGELDEDSDGEDGMDVDMTDGQQQNVTKIAAENNINYSNMEEYVSAPLFATENDSSKKNTAPKGPARQLGEAAPPKLQPVEVDDDGFAAVAKPTRRSRRIKS